MDAVVDYAKKRTLLAALVTLTANDGSKIAQEAVLYASKCMQGMAADDFGAGNGIGGAMIDVGRLVEVFAIGLSSKSVASKDASKKGLVR